MKYLGAWLLFIKERFEPISHFLMIGIFTFVFISLNEKVSHLWPILICLNTCYFFKMRLYDEIKDFNTDVLINPHRPLPRGLLSHHDMFYGIGICTAIEFWLILLFAPNLTGLFLGILSLIYLFFMYNEFFIGHILSKHLTTYAVTHTFVSVLIVLVNINLQGMEIDSKNLLIGLSIWPLFNFFEFGRKSFQEAEEREGVTTYTSQFGKTGASALLLSQCLAYIIILHLSINSSYITIANISIFILVFLICLMFINSKKLIWAQILRSLSSIYLILSMSLLIYFNLKPGTL